MSSESKHLASIVMITMDRLHLLRSCFEKVLANTTATDQIVLWDNASTDGTVEFLRSMENSDPRLKVLYSETNIGLNAYAEACKFATNEFIIELDDDIIDAPKGWDEELVRAIRHFPQMGYLASNIIDDGKSTASDIFFRKEADRFIVRDHNAEIRLTDGPVGGYCTITTRKIYDQVGGFPQHRELFFREDGEYHDAVRAAGYDSAILTDLRVFHASGPAYSQPEAANRAKSVFYTRRNRVRTVKRIIKQTLSAVPGIDRINKRYGLWS